MAVYARLMAEDNREELSLLQRNLARALGEDVTPRQREVLLLYYSEGMTMKEIADKLGVDRSTVSRTILRGEERLRRCLRYGGAALLNREPPRPGTYKKRGIDKRGARVG